MESIQDSEIETIEVIGFVRRAADNVFLINVVYNNGWEVEVSRRYSDFVALHRALLKFYNTTCHIPPFPAFTDIFKNVFVEDGISLHPSLEMLDDYCSALSDINNQLIQEFFESCEYDTNLNRRNLPSSSGDCDRIMQGSLPQYLVLMDYSSNQGTFIAKAGDIVTRIGLDRQDWALIGLKTGTKMQFGWIPSIYLLDVGRGDDPLIKDITAFYKELNEMEQQAMLPHRDPTSPFRSSSAASHTSTYSITSSTGAGGRDSVDLMKEGVSYYHYCLTDDCFLSSPFVDDVLISNGEKVVVVDKDTDGWWYVCCSTGHEGWLPSTILEPRRASIKKGKRETDSLYYPSEVFMHHTSCYVNKAYTSQCKDELSLKAGVMVHLIHESPSGWWTIRHGKNVGLVPGLFLTKKLSQRLSQSLRKVLSIGFNTSFLTEPPPRREIFSRCASPISPPPVLDVGDSAMFIIDSDKCLTRKEDQCSWATSFNEFISTSESGSETCSPQLLDYEDTTTATGIEDDTPIESQHHKLPGLSLLPDQETLTADLVASLHGRSSTCESPSTPLPNVTGRHLSPSSDERRSPIPDRFLGGKTSLAPRLNQIGREANVVPERSVSPLIGDMNHRGSIPNRFTSDRTGRSLTPNLDRAPKSPIPNWIYQRNSKSPSQNSSNSDGRRKSYAQGDATHQLATTVSPLSHNWDMSRPIESPTDDDDVIFDDDDDDVIIDDIIGDVTDDITLPDRVPNRFKEKTSNNRLVKDSAIISSVERETNSPDDGDRLAADFPEKEETKKTKKSLQRQKKQLSNVLHNQPSTKDRKSKGRSRMFHQKSLHVDSQSNPDSLPIVRASSAPPTIGLPNKPTKKIDLRKFLDKNKATLFIPQVETQM